MHEIAFQTCVREVQGSNPGSKADYAERLLL